jgi:hypothetical protein
VLYPLAKGLSATPIDVCELCEVLTIFQKTSNMMREKLLSGCDKDLKLWVQEHRPRNVNTLVELAESFQGARKHVQVGSSVLPSVQDIFRRIFLSNC